MGWRKLSHAWGVGVIVAAVTAGTLTVGAEPAQAKSNHHCGSLYGSPGSGVGQIGDLSCLGETKDANVGNLMGSLPTCGDTGQRSVPVGLNGSYLIVSAGKVATTYNGRNAWRYRWDYVRSPGTFAGYRYCTR